MPEEAWLHITWISWCPLCASYTMMSKACRHPACNLPLGSSHQSAITDRHHQQGAADAGVEVYKHQCSRSDLELTMSIDHSASPCLPVLSVKVSIALCKVMHAQQTTSVEQAYSLKAIYAGEELLVVITGTGSSKFGTLHGLAAESKVHRAQWPHKAAACA